MLLSGNQEEGSGRKRWLFVSPSHSNNREIFTVRDSESYAEFSRKSETCEPYQNRTDVSNLEYLLVECHSNSNPAVQYSFHANVLLKPIVKQKIETWTAVPEKPISVAIVVLDSVSRIHAYRSLNKTMSLLLRRLNFIDFKGHHDLGEPTIQNAVPLLLGESSAAEFFEKQKTSWTDHWDRYDFIWKRFSDLNYVTMFAEDDPVMGTFNFGTQRGFRKAVSMKLYEILL